MSRSTVRAAMAAWLVPQQLPGINTVYRGFPTIIPGGAFFPAVPGGGAGAVVVINVSSAREQRIAIGGAHGGQKRVDYVVEFHLFYRSTRKAPLGGDAGLDMTDDFDQLIDALKTRIRADRTAESAAIWQWGEGELSDQIGEPRQTGHGLEQWGKVRTQVTEWLFT